MCFIVNPPLFSYSMWWSSPFLRQRREQVSSWVWTLTTTVQGAMGGAMSRALGCLSVSTATGQEWWVLDYIQSPLSPSGWTITENLSVHPAAGDHQHRSFHDAQHVSAMQWEREHHKHALRFVPRVGPNQKEADCDGAGSCRWVLTFWWSINQINMSGNLCLDWKNLSFEIPRLCLARVRLG